MLHPQDERGPQSAFLCGHPEPEKTPLVSALVVWEEARVRLIPPSLAQQWPVARGHSGNRDTRTVPPHSRTAPPQALGNSKHSFTVNSVIMMQDGPPNKAENESHRSPTQCKGEISNRECWTRLG